MPMGMALTIAERLAIGIAHSEARNRHRLASKGYERRAAYPARTCALLQLNFSEKLHHLSELRRLYAPRDRSILVERQVCGIPLRSTRRDHRGAVRTSRMPSHPVASAL
jgi:hypothetical protein